MARAADGSLEGFCWLGVGAFFGAVLLTAAPAHAQRVERDCARLSDARWQELEARLRVLLGVHARADAGVELRCDETSAGVVLSERGASTRLPLEPSDDLVEATLAAVEAELTRRRAAPAASAEPPLAEPEERSVLDPSPRPVDEPAGAETVPSAEPVPPVEPRAPAASSRASAPALLSGGIGLGVGAETWGSELPALGPRLHLALGHADVCVVAVESLGFGRLEDHAALTFGTELGAAWGAPYASGRTLGAQLLLGHEWLSASEHDAAPSQTSGVWSVALGLRAALPVAPVSLFAGPDLRLRLGANELGPPLSLGLPSYSVLVQAGAFWIQQAMPARR